MKKKGGKKNDTSEDVGGYRKIKKKKMGER